MSERIPSVIVISYHSYRDPLFHGLILQYLQEFGRTESCRFHVITHEHKEYLLDEAEKESIRQSLDAQGISWYPIPYSTGGRLILLYKLINLLQNLWTCFRIRVKHKPIAILGFLNLASHLAAACSILLRLKLIVFCFEPHSAYTIDFGIWKRSSLNYRLSDWLERMQVKAADFITVPTDAGVELLQEWKAKATTLRVPISVDTDKFKPDPKARERIRAEHGFGDRPVILYLGKFSGIYYDLESSARFMKQIIDALPEVLFYVISTSEPEELEEAFDEADISEYNVTISGRVPYDEVEQHISASDYGLIAIPPYPSQKFRTPIKTGNYLACGLPVIMPDGVADEAPLLREHDAGIVLKEFSQADAKLVADGIRRYREQDQQELQQRCRQVALDHRRLELSGMALQRIFNALIAQA